MSGVALEFRAVTKAYQSFLANDGVTFSVKAGHFHGIVGENGAGKSTLMKMLYGLETPTSGEILIDGVTQRLTSPQAAIARGVGMVHQHFHLVGSLPAWKNVILGEEKLRLREEELIARLKAISEDAGISVPLDVPVETLSVGEQQQVELLKLLYRDSRILILDEPTAVLTPQEVDKLLERLSKLKARGKTILFVTHKLREILKFTDSVTVLRHGKVTLDGATSQFDQNSLAEAIIGKKRVKLVRPQMTPGKDAVLELKDATLEGNIKGGACALLDKISLKVHKGEILGVAGVEGNGQNELVEIVTGLRQLSSGDCVVAGKSLRRRAEGSRSPEVAVIPPDRHSDGLVLDFSVWENALLGHQRDTRYCKNGWVDLHEAYKGAEEIIRDYDVRPSSALLPIRSLSGGNQQKLIMGRELGLHRQLVVAAHPTRGVDIGAMDAIHQRLLALKEQGVAILLLSSELDEIMRLSDRIIVLYRGGIQGETTWENASEQQLGCWMMGAP